MNIKQLDAAQKSLSCDILTGSAQ